MKGFQRNNQFLSLCGLNCGLCPMHLSNHCGGCGNGNQSCQIARCSLEHKSIEYCFECHSYPCKKYLHIDDFDSFITHQHQIRDLEKAQKMGMDAYNQEQQEKIKILYDLLKNYNDGRRKNFFCIAVNLLELSDLQTIMKTIQKENLSTLSDKEKSLFVVDMIQKVARSHNISLKPHKKINQ